MTWSAWGLTTAQASVGGMAAVLQDDNSIVGHPELRPGILNHWKDIGGTNIRINIHHGDAPAGAPLAESLDRLTLAQYDEAINDVIAAGFVPQLTLVWYRQTDPSAIAAWAKQVVAHFGPSVRLYSVLNEPDLSMPVSDACSPEAIKQLIRSKVLTVVKRRVAYRKYLSKWIVWKRNGVKRRKRIPWLVKRRLAVDKVSGKIKYRTFTHRRYRMRYRVRAVAAANVRDSTLTTVSLKEGCIKLTRGIKYRPIFLATSAAIREANPIALVLAGETSTQPGVDQFIKTALKGGLPADGWAHHPYQYAQPDKNVQPFGIGDCARVRQLVGMPLYFTEWGLPQTGSAFDMGAGGSFTQQYIAHNLPLAWRSAKQCGALMMAQYMFYPSAEETWDTSLNLGPNQPLSPAFHSLKQFLANG